MHLLHTLNPCFEQTFAASNTGGSFERCAQRERASNKSTFGRVTGLSGEMLYEIETRVTVSGPLARRAPGLSR